MKTSHALAAALVAALAAGCAAGPDYHAPKVNTPATWSEANLSPAGATTGAVPIVDWWKTFHDPELDSLMDRAVTSNLDLKMAAARVREARAQYRLRSADQWPSVETADSYTRLRESKNQPLVSDKRGAFYTRGLVLR